MKNAECSRCGRVAPGTVMSRLWKLRLKLSGRSLTIFDSMRRPVSLRSVCSIGLSPCTVIDSSIAPTSILKSTRTVVLTATMTPSRTTFLNPASSPTTLYVPSFKLGKL